jgi:peptide/nickel transport system substrate-binding protein
LKVIADPQAQLLGVQSGDLDLALGLVPEQAKGLPREVEAKVVAGLRLNFVLFNVTRPLFADRAVREAFALGIDRAAINTAVFDGQGEAASGMFPSKVGGFDVLPIQSTDAARAAQVLDVAGWRAGVDGVRSKDGVRLAFTLPIAAGPVGTSMAVMIQAQLKPLGFDIQPLERQGYDWLYASDFDAAVSSTNTLPTGDPGYFYNVTFAKDASFNFGKYTSSQLDTLIAQLRVEPDAAKRNALSRQVQEQIRADIPIATLAIPPRVEAIRAGKVKNLTVHPSDQYVLDDKIAIAVD